MSEIPAVTTFNSIDKDATCQEASPMSGNRYIACAEPARAIVASDGRAYLMCAACAVHNLRNRGAALIFATDVRLKRMIANKEVKVVKAPDGRDYSAL